MRGRRRGGYEAPKTEFYLPPMAPPGPAQGTPTAAETVDHPPHYNAHPSGVEHMGFNLGNAIKYIWRADEKGRAVEDLRKARWYLDRELARREGAR